MGNEKIALLVAAALMAGPLVANAASVTYDFTGTVTSVTGQFSGLSGSIITGTYTINLANATTYSGTIGSTTGLWTAAESSGAVNSIAPSTAYVFSDTATIGGYLFDSTATSGAWYSNSYVQGSPSFSGPGTTYGAYQEQVPANGPNNIQSYFSLLNSNEAYTSNGLPVSFAVGNASDVGAIVVTNNDGGNNGTINYNITSLTAVTPVPLPAAAWLLVGGLGGIGAFARKKRAV